MKTLKTLMAILLVGILSILGMGVAHADGSLTNYVNSYRNQAGMASLPTKAEVMQRAQQKAQELANADVAPADPDASYTAGFGTSQAINGRGETTHSIFNNKWVSNPDIAAAMKDKKWTHIGSGEAKSASGLTYGVTILVYTAPPPPAPAPAPVVVQPPPAPAPVQPAPVVPAPVVPEPIVEPVPAPIEPAPVEPAPAPVVETPKVEPTVTPSVDPSATPSATPTVSAEPSPEVTETTDPLDGAQTGQVNLISKDTMKAGVGVGGLICFLFAGFSGLMARKYKKDSMPVTMDPDNN